MPLRILYRCKVEHFHREIKRRKHRRQYPRVENVSQIPNYAQHSACHLSIRPSFKRELNIDFIQNTNVQLLEIKRTLLGPFLAIIHS